MKKNYFSTLFAALMLFVAMPASAQVTSMSDLFGKWKFTATIEATEAGAEYASKFKSECDVTIGKAESEYFMADIAGFAGADLSMSVSSFDATASTFFVIGPNSANYGIWNGYIGVANADGDWPYMIREQQENGEWVEVQGQFGMTFSYNPDAEEITVADFTIVDIGTGFSSNTATVLAHVKNAKMTLIEAENKDTSKYPDLTGVWTYEGPLRDENNQPTTFNVEFAQAGEGKDAWKATFAFGEYDPFTLDATFDGSFVSVPFDRVFLDEEKGIRFGIMASSKVYDGSFTFKYNSKTSMSLYDYIYVRRDTISTETNELAGAFLHQVFSGYITRENPDAYDWSGTYNVVTRDIENYADSITFAPEFDMVIEKQAGNIFVVTEMLGYKDVYYPVTPADDDKSATINLNGYSLKYLGMVGSDYAYHAITDINEEPTTLTLTINEDGSISFSDFSVCYKLYNAKSYETITDFVGAKATKKAFDWAGEYTLTATVKPEDGIDAESFPATFDVVVEYDEGKGKYGIMKFMNVDFHELNQGNNDLEIAEDGKSAILPLDAAWGCCFVGGAYPDYVILCDKEGNSTSVTVTLSDETLAMDTFTVYAYNFDTFAASKLATYSNVTLTRKPDPVITLTAEVTEATREFLFGSAVEGENKISIDWGDGTIVEGATITDVYDGYTTTSVTGTPKGSGEIKIYATDAICYFDCVSTVGGPGITTLDVSKATELTELYANGNKLTNFDGSMLEKLSKLYLDNNSLTEVSLPDSLTYLKIDNNKLTSFDASNLTAVTTLYVSENNLGTLDVSGMPALKSLYALNCGLTSIKIGALTTAKAYISVNNNLLETLDVSEATGLENGFLHAMGNNLTDIQFPNVKIKTSNISKNKFTLATIPANANVTNLTYVPQQDMVIEDIDETIDLSAQNNLVGFAAEAQPTVYTWMTEAGDTLKADVDYVEKAGKFTFIKEQTQKVYCTMTTAALPKFTGTNIFKTVAVTVAKVDTGIEDVVAEDAVEEIFDIFGRKLDAITAPGLYIVNGKKVLVK